ncbi:hypothetical protein [Pelotalea chapellei]|uniref:Polyketide cyclase/dehydrase/lipid transport protein n=1 Tax=Pelotalea chapellei TaxID=44671 RepID=A0ABS5U773_9BACT|nr:hypothetical protein [Pelotalea chapellei]MBT1071517.1 hypothetical protein [Pelotalea chapellei]
MAITTFRVLVHAQAETVWKLLYDRIENPQNYQPLILGSRITQRTPEGIIRESKVVNGSIRERISVVMKENAIHTVVLEHPLSTGTIVTRVLPTSIQNPMAPLHIEVQVRLEAQEQHLKGTGQYYEEEAVRLLEEEMERVKVRAEELEQVL